jgi:hypothetical protein
MRLMRLFQASLILAVGLVVLGNAPGAWACSCVGYATAREARQAHYAGADLVFAGEARSSHDANPGGIQGSGDPIEWTFRVDSVQKGHASRPQIVSTARDSASCGFTFTVGTRYQVFADKHGIGYTTSLCGGTHVLAAGEQPILATTGVGGISPLLGAALLAGALSLAYLLRTRVRTR